MIVSTVIFDIEASCEDKKITPDYKMETIEIGAVKVSQGKIIDTFHTFVKPQYNSELTRFCTELTGITFADLKDASVFSEAILDFYEFAKDSLMYSCGDFDRKLFIKELNQKGDNCEHEQAKKAINSQHRDLKVFYNKVTGKKKKGMLGMAGELGIPVTGTHHRALSDAENTANIFIEVERMRNVILEKEFHMTVMRKLVAGLNAHNIDEYKITIENEDLYAITNIKANKRTEYTKADFLDHFSRTIIMENEKNSYISPYKLNILKRYSK